MDKLYRITGFIPFILIIFLNAFVDLGHKILIQDTIFKVHNGPTQIVPTGLFHLLTLTALAGAVHAVYRLPQSLVRYLISRRFMSTHRIQVVGFENLPGQGGVLILGHHISWLDWAMIQIACPARCVS